MGGIRRDYSKLPLQTLPVYGAELVQGHLSTFSLEADRHSCRVGPGNCGHGSDHDGPQIPVHFIGRDHEAGTGFLDLSALGRIQAY